MAVCHIQCIQRGEGSWPLSSCLTWQRSRQKRNGTLVRNAWHGNTASDMHSKSSSRVSSVLCRCSFQTATHPCLSRTVDSRQTGRLLAARRRNHERSFRSCAASSRLDLRSRALTAPRHASDQRICNNKNDIILQSVYYTEPANRITDMIQASK